MKYKLYTLNSFVSKNGEGGNPAGVIFENGFSHEKKQKIAKIHNLSEIAFLEKGKTTDYKVEFYTPNSQIDLCGHATIALFGLMKKLEMIENNTYSVETLAGIINVSLEDNHVFMTQNLPIYDEVVDKVEIAKSLNVSEKHLNNLLCQKVSTGLFDIIIGINSLSELENIQPNFDLINQLSVKYDSVGYHLYAISDNQIYTRNFAPRYAINEESATGSATGALACFLFKNKLLELNKQYLFKQGYFMNSPSNIYAKLVGENKINQVLVGGEVGIFNVKKYFI